MTDYNDGKIHGWNGGDCPVHPETELKVWFRNGGIDYWPAKALEWTHHDRTGDIIAFRVVKEHREPKTIWVVRSIYTDEPLGVWNDEADAWKFAGGSPETLRVEKYVEAQDD